MLSPVFFVTIFYMRRNRSGEIPQLRIMEEKRSSIKLKNSMLKQLDVKLSYLPIEEKKCIWELIKDIFTDVPRHTNVAVHDVESTEHKPIRQHPYRLNSRKLKLLNWLYAKTLHYRGLGFYLLRIRQNLHKAYCSMRRDKKKGTRQQFGWKKGLYLKK